MALPSFIVVLRSPAQTRDEIKYVSYTNGLYVYVCYLQGATSACTASIQFLNPTLAIISLGRIFLHTFFINLILRFHGS